MPLVAASGALTGLGVLASAAIPAIGSAVGAKLNSNAAKDAAKIQADSAQKALDERKRLFDIETANRKPYLDASMAALGRLGQSAGQPMNLPAAYQNPYAPKPQGGGFAGMLGQMGQMAPRQGGMQPQGGWMPQGQNVTSAPGSMQPQGQPMAQQGAPQAPQGDLVTVQAPNGQTARLPRQQAEMAVQKGARIVPSQGVQ